MRILITNDDGIRAPGLASLVRVAQEFGEVKVVAPDRERSACGHSMTLHEPLRATPVDWPNVQALETNGVPVDCVIIGLTILYPEGCDLVLSGFNAGPNLGFDVTYSGTVAGAMEGTINGIRSVSLSMASFVSGSPFHWATGEMWLRDNFLKLINAPLSPMTFLNVNVPNIDYPEIRGHRVSGMGKRVYEDRVEARQDPWGRNYYWQGGVVVMNPDQPGTDVQAVSEGFVSITPITLDWTATSTMADLDVALR
ncbi:MAG: 5'/3'-nucleotidase SurE [Fimbriimonadaceae bacterium]